MGNKIQKLPPFIKFCYTVGMIPTSYKVSMTYQEQLEWLCDFLENTVIPTVNNNGQAVEELQALYVQLKEYVDNYFENLDVQTEINNKLDEMVEDGTLAEIINQTIFNELNTRLENVENEVEYLKFDTLQNLIAADVEAGSYCQTLGYNSIDDKGAGHYYISNNVLVADGGKIVALENSLFAVLIDTEATVEQYGIFESNEDNRERLQNYFNNNDIIKLPKKSYNVIGNLSITNDKTIFSNHCQLNFTNNEETNLNYALLIGNETYTLLASNLTIAKSTNTFNIVDNGLKTNDIIKIRSSENWNVARDDYTKGELAQIKTEGNSFTIFDHTHDSYNEGMIYKLNAKKINIIGNLIVNCVNNLYDNGLKLSMLKNSLIEGIECYLNGTTRTSILFTHCYDLTINYAKSKMFTSTTGGTDYGISLANCQLINILNCNTFGNRHGLTTANSTEFGGAIVNRFIKTNGNYFSDNNLSVGLHGAIEYAEFYGNFHNGIGIGGQYIKVRGNIYNYTNTTCVSIGEFKAPFFDISNCNFFNYHGNTNDTMIGFSNREILSEGMSKFDNNNYYSSSSCYVLQLQPSSYNLFISSQNSYVGFQLSSYMFVCRNLANKTLKQLNVGGTYSNSYAINYPAKIETLIQSDYTTAT